VLESTIPFYTGPAWASYATGSSPAAHGVYDFMMLRDDGRLSVARQSDLRRPTYYQQLGREGRRSVLINLPLDQDGCEGAVIVNSWLTDDDARRILPFGRRERYRRLLESYRTFPSDPSDTGSLCELEQARFDLARELFLAEDWDHFFCLFSSTDWAGHQLTGRFLQGDEDAHAALLHLYIQLDKHIGWLVEHAGDATVVVMSDHGQTEETVVLRVNTVLQRLGLLALDQSVTHGESPFFVDRRRRAEVKLPSAVGRLRGNRYLRPAGLFARRMLARGLGVALVAPSPHVDRLGSRAFMPTDASFAVYAPDPDAVEPARQALEELTLPDGRPAIDGVWTVDELYGREPGEMEPALLFSPALGVRPSAAVKSPEIFVRPSPGRGCHQRDGIMLLAGEGVAAGEFERASICDVAPTLLWTMEAGIAANGDGRVLYELFDSEFSQERLLREVEPIVPTLAESTNGDSAEVTRRLKALGYI
jgi:predicted AlkP superfamily phosphohydrolase/phosphomutase